ncbi:MAG TPA: alpha/beta fold hydrolase [Rhodanobacteraceae bacterium]|nr:alpha/beta fold hydrolase [Rhodanobacteraceae bacterium]
MTDVRDRRTAATELRVDTPFGELAALQWGDADAPPLLALHGWLDNAASFTRLAPLLAGPCRVIALDMPGHGHSTHLPERARRYHIVDQVDVVRDAADALGLERFDLLGHSLGAGIASLTAAATPARIRRLLLIEGLGPLADDGSQTLSRWRDAHARPATRQRRPRVFASLDEAVAARVAAGGLDADEARPIVARNLREVAGGHVWRSDPRLRLATPLRIEEAQVRRLLTGIEAATLLLLAEPATPYLPTALMDARAAGVTDIHVERLGGPHHLHIRQPREVASHILDFSRPAAFA